MPCDERLKCAQRGAPPARRVAALVQQLPGPSGNLLDLGLMLELAALPSGAPLAGLLVLLVVAPPAAAAGGKGKFTLIIVRIQSST